MRQPPWKEMPRPRLRPSNREVQGFLVIDSVSKSFGAVRAVDRVSLEIKQGEVFSLLGPSGCGKTTLLRLLAGFETPDSGRILLNGADLTRTPPERRPINTVFQNYALFPHLTVWDNVAFGLQMERKRKAEIRPEVDRMLNLVRLSDQAQKRPGQLSGGQRQRVAIARALVKRPEVLLLDEPLAALDLKLRQHMVAELTTIHEQVGTTFIYVTHDQGEAISLSDRIAVLNEGRVEQVATPEVLYRSPATAFVASFIGDTNLMQATVVESGDGMSEVMVPTLGRFRVASSENLKGGAVMLIRPERFTLSQSKPVENGILGKVTDTVYYGTHHRMRLEADGRQYTVQASFAPPVGSEWWISFAPEDAHLMPP